MFHLKGGYRRIPQATRECSQFCSPARLRYLLSESMSAFLSPSWELETYPSLWDFLHLLLRNEFANVSPFVSTLIKEDIHKLIALLSNRFSEPVGAFSRSTHLLRLS